MGCGPTPPCVRDRRCAPDPPVQPARPRPSPYPGFASLAGCAVCGIHDGSKRVSPELRTVCGTRMRILIAFRARFVPLTHRQLDRLGPVCRPQVAIRLPPAFGAESSRCKLRPPGPQRASHRVSHGPHRSIRAFHLICHGVTEFGLRFRFSKGQCQILFVTRSGGLSQRSYFPSSTISSIQTHHLPKQMKRLIHALRHCPRVQVP